MCRKDILVTLEVIELAKQTIAIVLAYIIIATVAGAFQAWIAAKMGDDTAYHMGFTSFHPFVHIDPISLIIVPIGYLIFGVVVGLGRPVPILWHRLSGWWRWFKFTVVALAQPIAIMATLLFLLMLRLGVLVALLHYASLAWLPVLGKVVLHIINAVAMFAAWFIPYEVLMSLTQIFIYEQERRGKTVNAAVLLLIIPFLGAILLIDTSSHMVFYSLDKMEIGLIAVLKSLIGA